MTRPEHDMDRDLAAWERELEGEQRRRPAAFYGVAVGAWLVLLLTLGLAWIAADAVFTASATVQAFLAGMLAWPVLRVAGWLGRKCAR